MRIFLTCSLLIICTILYGQVFFDGFEGPDLSAWSLVKGNADATSDPVQEGNLALRLWNDDPNNDLETIFIHQRFKDNYGTYIYYTRADGELSDADFYFQYIDSDNYYEVSHKPTNTDNPEFVINKIIDGVLTELFRSSAIADTAQWIKVEIDRRCDRPTTIRVDDVLITQFTDTDILVPGSIVLRSWGSFTYFDSVSFVPAPVLLITPIMTMTCSGSGFAIGSNIYNASGSYIDTLMTIDGCDSVVMLELIVFDDITIDTTIRICTGDNEIVGDSIYNVTGTYIDTLATSEGCDSIILLDLIVLDDVIIDTIFRICNGDEVIVGLNSYSNIGSYVEQLTTSFGCDSTVNFDIVIVDTIYSDIDTSICMGDAIVIDGMTITTEGVTSFSFMSINGCDSIVNWNVAFVSGSLDLGSDLSICPGETSLTIDAGDFSNYIWSTSSNLSSITVADIGTYSVTVTDDSGCTFIDSIVVTEQCDIEDFVVANIFSPNGDNLNDTWRPTFTTTPMNYAIRVYDRWGSLVFQSIDPDRGWDGEANGQRVQSGVYIWTVKVDGQDFWGDVTVVR